MRLVDVGEIAIVALLRPLGPAGVDLAGVEALALFLVAEQAVGGGDLLELVFLGLVAGIEIGVVFLGELPIGLLDIGGGSGWRDAEQIDRFSATSLSLVL